MMNGEKSEGENVFGSGSMTGICISIFVKRKVRDCKIRYFDIGENLSKGDKLWKVKEISSLGSISASEDLISISPNALFDWINQRDETFFEFIKLGDKRDKDASHLFENYSLGINTNRDSWCFNYSDEALERNMRQTIDFYNQEVDRFQEVSSVSAPEDFVETDKSKISWTSSLFPRLKKGEKADFENGEIIDTSYRPFSKTKLYYDAVFNHRRGQMQHIFPASCLENRIICVTGVGSQRGYSALMANNIVDIHFQQNGQCFPLKLYAEAADQEGLFAGSDATSSYHVRDGITDAGLKHVQVAYPREEITKEDVFYYTYGLLQSEEYRRRYADNLAKELPRIPCVKKAEDFWAFSRAGRTLGDLHVNYESIDPYPVTIKQGDLRTAVIKDPEAFYRVTKMKYAGKRGEEDKSMVIYNANITMQDIPLEAYDYVVNGKPALEWVRERQIVKTDTKSGIINDANRYAIETMGNPAYPLELFQRVITVSLETMKIVRGLPKLDID